ncbi:MAG TPA: hypothetical protein VK735_45370 [Pseudonocardia sp.]|uniref:hypothetical protein n=1 Tax=Pseudonocardia sp. TaxID=60912 RepID=UPI002CE23729|nr:hypothetical protein [Pseudonocardia sp.]HTF54719.1 hypothetical protein [Pseudonocardia sp.]
MTNLDPRLARAFTWAAPALSVLFGVGFMPLAGFFPPPAPSADSATIARLYIEHQLAIQCGCFLMIIGLVLLIPWGIALAALTDRIPGASTLLTYGQLACVATSTTLIEIIPTTWALAAYRPTEIAADITRTVNDFGWFLLLFAWPPFSLWSALVAIAIFRDHSATPLFPRWAAYLSLWNTTLLVPGGLMAFFKVGPFAWNGVMAFYVPLFVFFGWLVAITVVMFRATANPRLSATVAA